MTKRKDEETGQKPRRAAFRPTQEQRAFVAAAAGLGIPRRVIRQMLPGAKSGETVSITGRMLTDCFAQELREKGLALVVALAGARLCQRALSGDDRNAQTAQMMVLNARGWKLPAPPEERDEISLAALSREERKELRRLLDKATPGQKRGGEGAAEDEMSAGCSPLSRTTAPERDWD
jgi:hypothetical protein